MLFKIYKLVKSFLLVSVSDRCKTEFEIGINRINVARGKITAITFIAVEAIMLIASLIIKRDGFLKKPDIYYGAMYVLLLMLMIVYLLIFVKLEKNIPEYGTSIRVVGVTFASIILLWCGGISLLDQLSSGQIIVYVVAIISVAVTPIYEPVALLLIYSTTHAIFLILMPYFQESSGMLLGDYTNSTTFLIVAWAISYMRYKKQVEDFNNRKTIQEKSDELKRVNKELVEANQKLEKLSQIDSLTGIFNRSVFDRTIKTEWNKCKRYFAPLSLIMIDIDFFKAFNDNYGHQEGDNCIKEVARVLSDCARRSTDIVTRYGGEEFAVILPYMEKESVLELAEQMRRRIEELAIPHGYSSTSEYVTISLGVCTNIPSDKMSVEEFVRSADKALYEAKRGNRNNIAFA